MVHFQASDGMWSRHCWDWAASVENSYGIWGASRHALTGGFLGMMVFVVGQQIAGVFRYAIAVQHETQSLWRSCCSRSDA